MGRLSAILAFLVLSASATCRAEAQPTAASEVAPPAVSEPAPPPAVSEPAPPPAVSEPAPPPAVSEPASAAPTTRLPGHGLPPEDARTRDAHVDRVLLLPTAETQPSGTTSLASYEIAIVQIGYALNDSTQLSFTTTPPNEGIFPLDFAIKSRVAEGSGYRLAVFGGVSGALGLDDGPLWIGRVGMVSQACFDRNCRSSASFGAAALLAGPATLVATGAGLVLRVSELFAVLAEVDTLVPSGRDVAEFHGIIGGAGFRWSGRRWAVDGAIHTTLDSAQTIVPFLAASYRFLR
jgi:hypothetical protein